MTGEKRAEAGGVVAAGSCGGDGGGVKGVVITFLVPAHPGSERRQVEEVNRSHARGDNHSTVCYAPGRANSIWRGVLRRWR